MEQKNISSGSSLAGFGRTAFARLEPGDDLIQGIKEVCQTNEIFNGVILCCIGSLDKAVFSYGKLLRDPTVADAEENRLEIEGPLSLVACQGVVCRTEPEGDLSVHLHGMVQDNNGRVVGQDFAEFGNIVFNTVDLVIADIGIDIIRRRDPELPGLITSLKREGKDEK